MTNSHANWHFPRTELAHKILESFRLGLTDRFTIFAPRRRGKTEFVKRDITPMAREKDILVVYVDFWRDKSSPATAFAVAVETARREQESWFTNLITRSSLKASLSMLGGDVSLQVSERQQIEKKVTEAAFAELEATDKTILLLLDEVQHLATKPEFSDFTAALRSFMTARSDSKVKGVFTGSSQEGLAQMFRSTRAPFYNASSMIEFPDLSDDFVEFELKVFEQVTGGAKLSLSKSKEVFESMSHSPGRFTDLLKTMALEGVHDIDDGVSLFASVIVEQEYQQFHDLWCQMQPVDRAILIQIHQGNCSGFYSDEFKEQLNQYVPNLDLIKNSAIQNSVNRLKADPYNLIYSSRHGEWRLSDPGLLPFIQRISEEVDK